MAGQIVAAAVAFEVGALVVIKHATLEALASMIAVAATLFPAKFVIMFCC